MSERRYKSVLRRIKKDKLEEWSAGFYDMLTFGEFPVMAFILDIKRELDERGERDEERIQSNKPRTS